MGFSLDASSEDEIVVVLRHGIRMDDVESQWLDSTETPWNPPLSDAGILQAKETAQTLSALGIRRVICSPFLRCLETAALVMESLGLPHSACTIDCCVAEVMDTRILVRGDGHGRVAAPAAEQLSLGTLLADAHGILAARGIRIADEAAVADGELPPPGETVSPAIPQVLRVPDGQGRGGRQRRRRG
uniref:Phosphoglycerate mutase-like protein n=1 Tax=Tetraselmis sp. GSL018 TaxID=582737 RepID=A0A061R113_9CHLO